jgi:hypothetical protein
MFFHLFLLCSACVKALVIVLSRSQCERIGKMGDLSDFESEHIVGACLSGASVTNIATLLGVSSAKVSKIMVAYMNHGKTTLVKRNSG